MQLEYFKLKVHHNSPWSKLQLMLCRCIIFNNSHCMKIQIFVLWKIVKRTEKIIFSLIFVCFCFTKKSYFLNFASNENVRKQHLSVNAYSCVNIKFSYTIAVRKDEIFCRFVTKTSDFSPAFRSTFRWGYLSEMMKSATLYCS